MDVEKRLIRDAVLRIGEVTEVSGRRIFVTVDKNKNSSDLFLEGDVLNNISVNGYVEIRKGFLSIIGKVEGEKVVESTSGYGDPNYDATNRNHRILTVALSGYIDKNGRFVGGTKELPLIGNEAFVVTKRMVREVHNLVGDGVPAIHIATLYGDDIDIPLPVDGLFNSHIAIFGNTGSGKSNTLAYLYQEMLKVLRSRNEQIFKQKARFVIFDFNGEYAGPDCIAQEKKVYNLSTRGDGGDVLPMHEGDLLEIETLSILTDATEKTQRPFLVRALHLLDRVMDAEDSTQYFRGILKDRVRSVLQMTDKQRAFLLLDYLKEILSASDALVEDADISGDLEWHNNSAQFALRGANGLAFFTDAQIPMTRVYQRAEVAEIPTDLVGKVVTFLYIQLITDVISNRAQNEHIAPVINRLKRKRRDIEKLFGTQQNNPFWSENIVVVNLNHVNLDMKKTIPLLLSKKLYLEQKDADPDSSLTIIIDEAHNILSSESYRESETWKDYRLETFEEIVKEGRKFGVFVTIASQRPNDISATITSQAHNYFIHRLINEKDLATISSAVSYIDRLTEESIPTLPTGTCIFSGIASQMPLKLNIKSLPPQSKPKSETRRFTEIIPKAQEGHDLV